jgi:hypothetical protein
VKVRRRIHLRGAKVVVSFVRSAERCRGEIEQHRQDDQDREERRGKEENDPDQLDPERRPTARVANARAWLDMDR